MTMKSGWAFGPWIDEPDEEIFWHHALQCRVLRMERSGHLCGYVDVPRGHRFFGVGYSNRVPIVGRVAEMLHRERTNEGPIPLLANALRDDNTVSLDLLFRCHGGLTYSGLQDDGFWRFGFDCNHSWGGSPRDPDRGVYRDFAYVREETKRLAEQLAEWVIA